MQRFFFSGAVEAELDKQGRVMIPAALIKHARARPRRRRRRRARPPGDLGPRRLAQGAEQRSKGAQRMLPNVLQPNETDHVPVLAEEVRELLAVAARARPSSTPPSAPAATRRCSPPTCSGDGRFIAIDRDPTVRPYFERFNAATPACSRASCAARSRSCSTSWPTNGVQADAILLDLGVSSMQIDRPERGFSYAVDAPLDMRMDPTAELSAAELVNEASERELTTIFRRYGEERYARQIARAIGRGAASSRSSAPASSSRSSRPRSPRRRASATGIRPSASSRRCGSRSTTSSARSRRRFRPRSRCCGRAAGSR